ncbi:hypothetical protein FOA52_004065 [Chlamydomonas sp. UWO 241]|nr:hypothetical protein FOA52_004065 [Chlamydomonas sp. UWO 241]
MALRYTASGSPQASTSGLSRASITPSRFFCAHASRTAIRTSTAAAALPMRSIISVVNVKGAAQQRGSTACRVAAEAPTSATVTAAPYPLDPLCAVEIKAAAAACRAHGASNGASQIRFNVISLKEPSKADHVAFTRAEASGAPTAAPPRRAFCILQLPGLAGVVEVTVKLPGGGNGAAATVEAWTVIEGVQALATPDDCIEAEAITKADPRVIAMLKDKYGVTDMSLVFCDPWSINDSPIAERAIQCFMYLKVRPEGNQYAHPIDMVPLLDMDAKKVVRIDTPHGQADKVSWNQVENDYDSRLQTVFTTDPPKPINITQPEGPSFTCDGNHIKWQKWSFRLGFNYREGIVLHDVKFNDGGKARPVLNRISLVEMAVPYADANLPFTRKCAFDVGDYGLGYSTSSLSLGCDCLGHIRYFDAMLSNTEGEPVAIPKAICMHEEDVGLLYKHVDYRTGHSESRRSRRLVISHITTVVNYEYCIYWYLYQDGTIGLDIKLTGELSTNMLSPGETKSVHGTIVGPGINAQHHQHMFCARIDPAIDDDAGGAGVVVSEVNVEMLPATDPRNIAGNAWVATETDLTSVHKAQREISPQTGRIWKMKNPSKINPTSGSPVAYKIVPMAHPPLLAAPGSVVAEKGYFATKQLWVTPHHDAQQFPAGDYVFGAKDCTGLKAYTKEDAPLVGADPVVWYSFGVTHVIRPEDFPIMPVEVCGFQLKPAGFFAKNPCLDLPLKLNKASKLDGEACCGSK